MPSIISSSWTISDSSLSSFDLNFFCLLCLFSSDLDGDQPVIFYYIDPGYAGSYAWERHAGKAKFKNKFYYQYEFEESWTRPGVRAFGRVNGGLAFQGFQKIAGNAVPLCSVFYADKAGSTKNCSHHPIYGIILHWYFVHYILI